MTLRPPAPWRGWSFFVGDGKKWGRDVKNMEEIDGDSEFFLNFAK